MPSAVRPARSADARDLALREVVERPGIQQRELAARLNELTGLAESTLVKLFRALEREGHLEGGLEGRRKTYRVPSNGRTPEVRLQTLVEDAAQNGRPAAQPAYDLKAGTGRQLTALVASIVLAAAAFVLFLAPDKDRDEPARSAAAAAATAKPEQAAVTERRTAELRRFRRATADLRAAKRQNVAVLSGVDIPGIARRTGRGLRRRGFKVRTVANSAGPSRRSLVLYTGRARRPARALGRELRIRRVARLDAANRTIAPHARLVVVLGADRRR